jgi:glucose-1-phosphate cytidylyltransferase
MKVVLFCGGLGMRLRGYSGSVPKPLVEVGPRPILWHLMKYYAHFGHNEFILCLGHGGLEIKRFFINYDEREMNDFVFSGGGQSIELFGSDIHDWRITFVDTGPNSNIGERLRRVRPLLGEDEMFLANYADGLTDLDLESYVAAFRSSGMIARMMTVPAPQTFHVINAGENGQVFGIEQIRDTHLRVNAGFFVLRREIFDHMRKDEELVLEPFERLIAKGLLEAVPYDGFWQQMDTFKDKAVLDAIAAAGHPPWQVWDSAQGSPS